MIKKKIGNQSKWGPNWKKNNTIILDWRIKLKTNKTFIKWPKKN